MFNDKKLYKQKWFAVIITNSKWETLNKNFLTFKRLDGVKDEKLSYFEGSWKNPGFRGLGSRNTNV